MGGYMNVVANNIPGMFSQRQLGITNTNKAKSTEKLSSGYKINRAADDAAGLTISEKLRFQIRGLNQGSNNIQDGISLVQTAEGALGEVHDMLHRMKELAVKGLSDTMTYEDRNACQEEINALYRNINEIAEHTTFNEISVLKGNPSVQHEASVERTRAVVDMQQLAPEMPSEYVDFGHDFILGGANISTQKAIGGKAARTIFVNEEDIEKVPEGYKVDTTPDGKYYYNVYRSDWSESLGDNFGTTVDFSNLAHTTGRTEIEEGVYVNNYYSALLQFVGTGFFTTCNSCDTQYNIVFTDNRGRYEFKADDAIGNTSPGSNVQINISDLLEEAQKEDLSAEDSKRITRELIERIEKRGNNDPTVRGHFTRYASGEGINEFKLAIYDFRDYDQSIGSRIPTYEDDPETEINYTQIPNSERGFGKTGNLQGTLYTYGIEVYVEGITYWSNDPINIQHGDDSDFCSKIDLPNLSSIFSVYQQYGYNNIEEALTIQEKIPERQYRAAGTYVENTIEIPERTYEYNTYKDTPGKHHDAIYNEAGELLKAAYNDPPTRQLTGTERVTVPAHTETRYEYIMGEQVHEDEHYGDVNRPILNVIDDLTSRVSEMRTNLGAQQNRLERALRMNQNNSENTQAAESLIRDTDMADEMVKYSKENILQQVGQSMLAQSNQSRQGILTLLQ